MLSITVNSLVDEQDGSIVDGDVSLRDAIAVSASGETIGFSVTGTINLTGIGDLVINKNLTINGPGASLLTIRAFNPSAAAGDGRRVFLIDDGNAASVKNILISGLTLTGGDLSTSGGAIRNASENLTISACTISGNASTGGGGGGVANISGNLTVTFSTISGNTALAAGGGIYNAGGSFNLAQSTVSGNSNFGPGGGISGLSTTMTIDSSTISGNSTANSGGGGISHGSSGTGILMTITNSTISGNSAEESGGGVLVVYSNAIIRHSTITANLADAPGNSPGNGGGLFVSAMLSNVTIDHTIVAGNLRQTSTRDDIFGTVSARYSLIGDSTGATITNNGGNQTGTAASPINSLLGPLANNGGPTLTHALSAGSPAIDTGDPAAVAGSGTVPATDQRGAPFGRVFDGDLAGGARIDIGALELQPTTYVVDITTDENDGNFSPGDLSLREALALANSAANTADTITFHPTVFATPQTITLTSGEIAISDAVTITGPAATVTVSGNNASRIFGTSSAAAGTAIVLQGLTLTNGHTSSFNFGGAVAASGQSLTIQRCAITNSVAGHGGAIFVGSGGSLLIEDSTLSGNSTTGNEGGAIDVFGNELTIRRSTLSGNTAGVGGAIFSGGSLIVEDSTLSGNTANLSAGGGAIYFSGAASNFVISNSTLSGNAAPNGVGGAVCLTSFSGTAQFRNSTITGNTAGTNGGGIARRSGSGTVSLSSTIVAGNSNTNTPDMSFNSTTNVGGNNNLVGVVNVGNFTLTGTGNQSGTQAAPLDAKLGTLVNNGGPTLTRLPLSNSPAINKGNNAAGLTFDQRGSGFPRAQLGVADVGAVEFFSTIPVASATAADVTSPGGTVHTITVQYFDDVGINTATLGNSDITVNGPGGAIPVTFTGFAGGGTSVTATYDMVPPGGSWDGGDFGTYSIVTTSNEVFDTEATHSVPAGTIGSFAVFIPIVSITVDENDGNFAANDVSLREAIFLANSFAGLQTITFDPSVFSTPQTITLTSGETAISDAVTIVGPAATLTISGNNASPSRIFNTASAPAGTAIVLQGLALTNGHPSTGNGGAILVGDEALTLQRCAITNSSAVEGGAIEVGAGSSLLIEDSTLSGNTATGSGGDGGAIDVGSTNVPVTIRRSTLSGNTAADSGGAIYFFSGGSLTVEDSTLSGNIANSPTGIGGGAVYFFGTPTNFLISNSTLSGNSAPTSSGGAIVLSQFVGTAAIQNSTITQNSAGVSGGGIARTGGASTGTVSLTSTIVAGNSNTIAPDLSFNSASNVSGNNNLIGVAGVGNFTLTGTGNQTGTQPAPLDAGLGPLANNGGPTMTRALLTGSPAIDAGDPAAVAGVGNVLQFDQRGAPFTRVYDSNGVDGARIDIGAFELHPTTPNTPALLGDYNLNTIVDAADYVVWRKTLGAGGVVAFSGADGDGNGVIEQNDYGVWRAHFGQTVPPGAGSGAGIESRVDSQESSAGAATLASSQADQVAPDNLRADSVVPRQAQPDVRPQPIGQISSLPSRARLHRYSLVASGDDDLTLLLAIDRVSRSARHDSVVSGGSGNGEHRADDNDSVSEIDEPLAVALVVRRGARSTYVVPG